MITAQNAIMATASLASLAVPNAEPKGQTSFDHRLDNHSLPASYRKNQASSLSLPDGINRVEWAGSGSSRGFEIILGAAGGFAISAMLGLGVRTLRNNMGKHWAAISGATALSAIITAVAVPDQITFTSRVEKILEQEAPQNVYWKVNNGKMTTNHSSSEYPQILRISGLNYDLCAKPRNSPFRVGEKISVTLRHKGDKLLYWNAEKFE